MKRTERRTAVALAAIGYVVACSAGGGGDGGGAAGSSAAAGASGGSGAGGTSGTGGGGALSGLDAGDDARIDEDAACLTETFTGDVVPSTVVFQLDTSRSMNCAVSNTGCLTGDPTADPNDSRWDLFRQTLSTALTDLSDATIAGLLHFPSTFSCASATPLVQLAPLSTSRTQIQQSLGSLSPDGITPTRDAVNFAHSVVAQAMAPGERFVVLATDGASTVCDGCDSACSFAELDQDNEAMIQDIATRAQTGQRTFIIGVQGSDSFRGILSRMATAAGTQRSPTCSDSGPEYCHYDLTDPTLDFSQSLAAALADISGQVLSCTFEIPATGAGSQFDPGRLNVRITDEDGMERRVARDPGEQNGWNYSDDMSKVVLHGPACDEAKAAGVARVDLLFGCPTEVL